MADEAPSQRMVKAGEQCVTRDTQILAHHEALSALHAAVLPLTLLAWQSVGSGADR